MTYLIDAGVILCRPLLTYGGQSGRGLLTQALCRSALALQAMQRLANLSTTLRSSILVTWQVLTSSALSVTMHALQVSHVDLTDSGVLACAYTKLKEWLVTGSPTNSWAMLSMHWGNHSASNRACGEPSSYGVCRWSTFTGSMIPRLPTGRAMTGAHNTGAPSSTMMMIRSASRRCATHQR